MASGHQRLRHAPMLKFSTNHLETQQKLIVSKLISR